MAEDFTTWTEEDSYNKITVAASKCTVTDMTVNTTGHVVRSAIINGDFEIQFATRWTSGTPSTYTELALCYLSGTGYINVGYFSVGWKLGLKTGAGVQYCEEPPIQGETHYHILKRVGTVITDAIYSDAEHLNLLDTLLVDDGVVQTYDTLYAVYGVELMEIWGDPDYPWSGYIEDMVVVSGESSGGPTSVLMTARLGGVRHTFRPGSYRLTLTLGGVTLTPEVMQIEMAIPKTEEPEKPTEPEQKVTVPEKTVPEVTEVVKQITEFDKFTEQVVKQPLPVQMFKGLPLEFWPSSDVATGNSPLLLKAKEDLEKLNKMAMQWIEVPGGAQLIPKEDKRSLWQKITDFFRGK
jgi:hypothetical protein